MHMLLFALAAAAPTLPVHPRAYVIAAVLFSLVLRAHATLNITLEDTAPQLTYSPPACGLTADSSGADTCNSAWQIVENPAASDGTLTTTSGPTNASGGFIPQVFLSVRALSLSIRTSPNSTALLNVSVSTADPAASVTARLNSSVQPLEVIGLVETLVTTLALTFEGGGVLDLDAIIVTVSDNNTTPFVSQSLPSSTVIPTSTPTPSIVTPTPSAPSSRKGQTSGDIAAEVLGAILGAILLATGATLGFLFYRRRRRKRAQESEAGKEHGT